MARRMPRSGEERRTTVIEHIEVIGQQLHRAVPLERRRLAVGKRPVDLSLLDQQRGIRKKVDIPYMVAVRVRDGDKSDVRRLKIELAKLGYQLLRARRMSNRCVDRLVGDRIRDRPMRLLTGDFDVFGDGSATLLSTPGHTPGHQSLLVHLDKTGWVLLTGDAAHFKDNWDNDRVPSINSNAEQTHASHALLAKIIAEKKAALWINHDLPTFDSLKHSPEFYD